MMTKSELLRAAEIVRSSAGARRTMEKVYRDLARKHPDALIYTEMADEFRGEEEGLELLAEKLEKEAAAGNDE